MQGRVDLTSQRINRADGWEGGEQAVVLSIWAT